MADERDVFNPGDKVPVSGIYDVIHDTVDGHPHTDSHQITAISGKVFPPCRGCQTSVQYRLFLAAEHVDAHAHFRR